VVAVLLAWVPFRATTLDGTLTLWSAMTGGGALLPGAFSILLPASLAQALQAAGLGIDGMMHVRLREWPTGLVLILGAAILAVALPASDRLATALRARLREASGRLRVLAGGVAAAMLFVSTLIAMSYNTVFLYFQF
jgi:hypothetical protein